MPLQSSKGKEPESGGKFLTVHNTANLGQGLGAGGGAGGGSGDQFKMQIMTPTGVNGGITTHNSINNNNFPFRWTSLAPGPTNNPLRGGPSIPSPDIGSSPRGAQGTMYKFTSEFAGKIKVYMWGGGGGGDNYPGGHGGTGGYTQGEITVTNGQTLYVVVAEGGNGRFDQDQPWTDTTYSPFGNYHGGPGPRGRGGGFSGIFVGSDPTDITFANSVMIAGGGGGCGGGPTSGPVGSPGGGTSGSPDDGNTSPTNAIGGSPTAGGHGSVTGGRVAGGTGGQLLGGGHPALPPPTGSTTAGGGAGYYGGGGCGDNLSSGGAGGGGYNGGHPTVPVSNGIFGLDDSNQNKDWPGKPTARTAPWPVQNDPLSYLQGNCGYGGVSGPGNRYGRCGRVVIEVLTPE